MKYVIGIPTINRYPKKNYLATTLKNLERGGVFNYPDVEIVISESGSENGFHHIDECVKECKHLWDKVTFLESGIRLSPNKNNIKILNHCAELTDEYVIYMQDDVKVRPDLMKYIDKFVERYPYEIMWVFYARYIEILHNAEKGIDFWRYPIEKYYGSLCNVLRKDDVFTYAKALADERDAGDIHLKGWAIKNHPEKDYFLASCPCYVQHIGDDSFLNPDAEIRINQSFDEYFKI